MIPPRINKTVSIVREVKQCPTCGQRFSRDAGFCPFDGVRLEASMLDPLGDPLIGAVIDGRYQVVELLGEGGTGRVYQVRHAALSRLFAMKILRRDLARDEELAARFIQEAKATASIRHPNVVEITDFGRMADGVPYLVMELLEGRTLGQIIESEGPLPASRAVPILRQVAGALAAAHESGIVHRDLKPDNVFLVGAAGDVRVVDFGAAKVVGASRVTRDGIVFGTPHYMSPEQASGQPVDHRADIYSLGVIMYEMFTGRVPFQADTYMGVLTQHMFVQPVPPSQVTAAAGELGALEEITLVCLSKKPEDRYASMALLSAAIERAVDPRIVRPDSAAATEDGVHLANSVFLGRRRTLPWVVFSSVTIVGFGVALAVVGREAANSGVSREAANSGVSREAASSGVTREAARSGIAGDLATDRAGAAPGSEAAASLGESAASRPPSAFDAGSGEAASPRSKEPTPAIRPRPRPRVTPIDDVGDPFAATR
jgi:serine/threonine-protein kinase